ncbi:hypothetical protein HDU83_005882 [Entophlyctis luteolus]|nr:hypothetical protein HDU83_005882 [Entophlyctis luteolus]
MAHLLVAEVLKGIAGTPAPLGDLPLSPCEDIFDAAATANASVCAYALAHCTGSSAVNYMAVYSCLLNGGASVSVPGILVLVLLLGSCFVSIAAVAGGFLCANLSAMAGLLSLSDTVAGVTLAALGNGAPDIFATYSAVRSGQGAMALGELLGAALFVTLVVVGGVAVAAPETHLPRRPFVRDIVFLLGCVAIVLYATVYGEVSLTLSIVFVLYYLAYVATVVVGQVLTNRSNSGRITEESLPFDPHSAVAHGGSNLDAEDIEAHIEARDSLSNQFESTHQNDNDFYEIDSSATAASNRSQTSWMNDRNGFPFRMRSSPTFVPHLNKELFPFLESYAQPDDDDDDDDDDNMETYGGDNNPNGASGDTSNNGRQHLQAPRPIHRIKSWAHRMLSRIDKHRPLLRALRNSIVPYLAKWDQMSTWDRLLSLASTPIGTSLKLTIPIVHRADVEKVRVAAGMANDVGELGPLLDREDSDDEEDSTELDRRGARAGRARAAESGGLRTAAKLHTSKLLMTDSERYLVAIQLFLGSQFVGSVFMERGDHVRNSILWASTCLIGSVFAALSFLTSKTNTVPSMLRYNLLCFFGFIVSIFWVYTVANEVVGLLNTLGIILHVDEVILGLTIFAIDLMTNLSIARMGYPRMALGACFGSPMMSMYINFLLGLGISTLTMTADTGISYKFETGPILRKSTLYLLASLTTTLVLVGISGFKTNKQIGKIMLVEYVVIVIFIMFG